MTERGRTTNEVLRTLRGEIFAAEMKVILDKELGRETSPIVKKLALLKLPRIEEPWPAQEPRPAHMRPRLRGRYVGTRTGAISRKAR